MRRLHLSNLDCDIRCIDLFCGAGGLAHGLKKQGINVVAGIDVEESCRYPFEFNNAAEFIKEDVAKVSGDRLKKYFEGSDIKVLAGGAPCQPFSTYSQRYDVLSSPRWGLLYQFARLVKETLPDIVAMENVPTVAKHSVFDDFAASLVDQGYFVHRDVIDCIKYGLPQTRRRMILLASKLGEIEVIPYIKGNVRTVRDAISMLPKIHHGQRNAVDPLHVSSTLSTLNFDRILASKPGGTWREWPKHLVAACHQKESGRTYAGVYGRMEWDQPSPTLTTQYYGFGNGRFGHPEQDRAISLREGAILQGFPMTYSFVPKGAPIHFKSLGKLIGNAVPVTLGEVIGQSIQQHIGALFKQQKFNLIEDGEDGARRYLVA